jgi:putative colanic acid biosynthesis acetyltransferase WcaF
MTMILNAKRTAPLSGGGASFTLANRVERAVWRATWLLLARWTPPMFSPWRICLLKLFGARIEPRAMIAASTTVWFPRHLTLGTDCSLGPGVDCYNMARIAIGSKTVISQRAFLCAGSHDIADPNFQLVAKPISIGDHVWIAAEAFVAPGVTVGDGAVLAARACAFGDLEPWTVYRGNPAAPLKARRWRASAKDGADAHASPGRSRS